jgi:hypothetical protein
VSEAGARWRHPERFFAKDLASSALMLDWSGFTGA